MLSHSPGSDSSSSTASDDEVPNHPRITPPIRNIPAEPREVGQEEEDVETDEARELPIVVQPEHRPPSSISSHRYRTPMAGSLAMSPPPPQSLPATQPMPNFETPSAFAEPSPISSPSYPAMSSYIGQSSESSRTRMATPTHLYPAHTNYRGPLPQQPLRDYPIRPASRLTLERAVENVQVHLTALTERMESLETLGSVSRSHGSPTPRRHGSPGRGRGSLYGSQEPQWNLDDLGMWSIVLNPLSRGLEKLQELATFFARNENRSPTSIIIRRLCLDASFLACVVMAIRLLWNKSGVRRREVRAALAILWRAILGAAPDKIMVDRGV